MSHSVVDVPSTSPSYLLATTARVSLAAPSTSWMGSSSHESIVNVAFRVGAIAGPSFSWTNRSVAHYPSRPAVTTGGAPQPRKPLRGRRDGVGDARLRDDLGPVLGVEANLDHRECPAELEDLGLGPHADRLG